MESYDVNYCLMIIVTGTLHRKDGIETIIIIFVIIDIVQILYIYLLGQ